MNSQNQKQIEKIQKKYQAHQTTKLEELKALDKKVTKPAKIFAYIFGSVSVLVFGTGMCLAMKVIFAMLHPAIGIGVGLLGMLLCYLNYLIYKATVKRRKNKYQAEILALCNDALNDENNN